MPVSRSRYSTPMHVDILLLKELRGGADGKAGPRTMSPEWTKALTLFEPARLHVHTASVPIKQSVNRRIHSRMLCGDFGGGDDQHLQNLLIQLRIAAMCR